MRNQLVQEFQYCRFYFTTDPNQPNGCIVKCWLCTLNKDYLRDSHKDKYLRFCFHFWPALTVLDRLYCRTFSSSFSSPSARRSCGEGNVFSRVCLSIEGKECHCRASTLTPPVQGPSSGPKHVQIYSTWELLIIVTELNGTQFYVAALVPHFHIKLSIVKWYWCKWFLYATNWE